MKKDNDIKVIVVNPPTKEHVQNKLKELGEFLSKEISRKHKNNTSYNNPT